MKLLIVTLCVLAAFIPAALSLQCYQCTKINGNCLTGEITCASGENRCGKIVSSSQTTKGCVTSTYCKQVEEDCKNQTSCGVEGYCCDSDLCNGGVPLKPAVTFLTVLTVGLAKYLM